MSSKISPRDNPAPHVMIAGAGLGGILLGVLLERIGIPYQIFERSASLRPLGSAMGFGANILPVFDQLGILDDLLKVSYPCHSVDMFDPDLLPLGGFEFDQYKKRTGYDTIMFPRPAVHSLLLSQLPPEKVKLGKRVLSMQQDDDGVKIQCSDGTAYEGDILVGADGAYSAVRQGLYKLVSANGNLPASDREGLSTGHICMVGTTHSLDPEKYPALKDEFSHCKRIIGRPGSKYSWSVVTVPGNKVCWALIAQLDTVEAKSVVLMNSEWGPESNAAMIKDCHDFPSPLGGTMGELIDATPEDMISKVFLEDKLFDTWNFGRTVLIGDGAVNAFQDAVILANCIYEMSSVTHENISAALKDYRSQRYPHAKYEIDKTRVMGKMLYGQTEQFLKDASYRPQCNFLPHMKNRGSVPVLEQKRSEKYNQKQEPEEQQQQQQQQNEQGNDRTTVVV
ncbi:hypothetical protein BG011_000158 [Mortierella polycephala]|uniref:FAD-binding domain-containing protein n=1 Tax=Mortierella polycephala TaxID=41804 RepID=A0A9P6U788_9FUNG|nr:hypothetical protein BG011_000158 [Mortierella polycephala]